MSRVARVKSTEPVGDESTNVDPKVKHPIPDGFYIPGDFALYVTHNNLWEGSQAQIYNLTKAAFDRLSVDADGNPVLDDDGSQVIKPANGFPAVAHTDGRIIIDREKGVAWLKQYSAAREVRKAAAREAAQRRNSASLLSVARYTVGAAALNSGSPVSDGDDD
jgi:hypothetical protein